MKTLSRTRAAFTLIELLTVMAIILVLAGLIIHVAGSAQYNSAKSRATAELHTISLALENYKSDNGTYPPDPTTPTTVTSADQLSSLLNPQKDFEPTDAKYITNSEYLYQVLSGFPVTVGTTPSASTTMSKAYMPFTPQQLKAVSSSDSASNTNPKMYIIDPFGFSYGYSTIASQMASQQASSTTPTNTANTQYGYNPTFDLWSTAGYSTKGGKPTPATTAGGDPASIYGGIWVKNW